EYFELGESRCSCAQSPTTPIFWPALILGLAVLRRKTRPTQTRERSRTDR
ncbi:MAG: MYXO-CTERM domain-containing protein, partial [Cognaticolwellia sp.]